MACPDGQYFCHDRGKCMPIPKGHKVRKDGELVKEVAPPGWGHTKAEKEKTDPSKPKSKIGGTIAAMKRAQDRGDIPKKLNIFALAYSMKEKGAKPHYKPGTNEKYKKYQDEQVGAKSLVMTGQYLKPAIEQEKQKKKKLKEAVKGQDTESRREGAKERAAEKKSGKIRKNTLDPKDYATQQKKSIEWHDKRTKGRFSPGEVTDQHEELTPMQDNNLFGNAYAGSIKKKKKKIKEGKDYQDWQKAAREAHARVKQAKLNQSKENSEKLYKEKSKGIKFYDKKGSGRIVGGRKKYD